MININFENYLSNTSFLLLFLSMIFYWIRLIFFNNKRLDFIGTGGIILSNFCIFSILVLRWIKTEHFPLTNLYESLLFLTWSLTLFHLYIENIIKKVFLGAITSPLILFTDAFSNFNLPESLKIGGPLIPALQSNWLIMHVSIMILSYSALLIGCLLSIVIIVLNNNIESTLLRKNYSTSFNIQSFSSFETNSDKLKQFINIIDNLSYRTIGIGFIFLTIGILSGAVWANQAWGSYWSWDPKETWAFITWLVFATYLHTRIIKGWEGIRPAIISTVGFFVIWICFLGVNIIGKGLHSYGWFSS